MYVEQTIVKKSCIRVLLTDHFSVSIFKLTRKNDMPN
jgi:hypothetical protein